MKTIEKAELVRQLSYLDSLRDGTMVVRHKVMPGVEVIKGEGPDADLLLHAQNVELAFTEIMKDLPGEIHAGHKEEISRRVAAYYLLQLASVFNEPLAVRKEVAQRVQKYADKRRAILKEIFS